MIIDAHAHVGQGCYNSLAPDEFLRQMDETGFGFHPWTQGLSIDP
jgi:hypothetical protein